MKARLTPAAAPLACSTAAARSNAVRRCGSISSRESTPASRARTRLPSCALSALYFKCRARRRRRCGSLRNLPLPRLLLAPAARARSRLNARAPPRAILFPPPVLAQLIVRPSPLFSLISYGGRSILLDGASHQKTVRAAPHDDDDDDALIATAPRGLLLPGVTRQPCPATIVKRGASHYLLPFGSM
jgi:hypothetical protein